MTTSASAESRRVNKLGRRGVVIVVFVLGGVGSLKEGGGHGEFLGVHGGCVVHLIRVFLLGLHLR